MVVPLASPTAWYLCLLPIGRGQPLRKGSGESAFAWINRNRLKKCVINLIVLLLMFSTNRSPDVENGGQNGIHHQRQATKQYE
jgi:hypothetical protein